MAFWLFEGPNALQRRVGAREREAMLRSVPFIVCLSLAAALSSAEPPTLTNLGAKHARLRGDRLVYSRWETFGSEDLNGDGDLEDIVLTTEDLGSRRVTNVGLLGVRGPDQDSLIGPFWEDGHAFWISEAEEGRDLNGDGDRADLVMHVHDAARGETTNTGLAVLEFPGNRSAPYVQQSGRCWS
jgi:hypothetical protein